MGRVKSGKWREGRKGGGICIKREDRGRRSIIDMVTHRWRKW